MIAALATALALLAEAIGADWEAHREPHVSARPWNRHRALLTMIDLAEPQLRGIDVPGFIHPELMGDKRLLGFWTI